MKQLPHADQEEMKEMNSQEKQAYLQSLLSQGYTNGSDILASSGRHRMTQKLNNKYLHDPKNIGRDSFVKIDPKTVSSIATSIINQSLQE